MGCVVPSGVQGSAEPGPRVGVSGESDWVLFSEMILLLSIGVCFFWEHAWLERWRTQRHSGHRATRLAARSPRGSARWVGRRRWRLSRRCHHQKRSPFGFPGEGFWRGKLCSLLVNWVFRYFGLLGVLVTEGEPTSGHHDVCSVGTLMGQFGRIIGRTNLRPHLPRKRTIFFFWVLVFWMLYIGWTGFR